MNDQFLNIQNNKSSTRSGQVLLIIVLLATVLVTIGLSLSKLSTDEQKVSKLEEDSKKAFSAAEAGLEAALKQGSIANLSSLNLGSGITGNATVQTTTATTFNTPPIKKDEQYFFYLSTYNTTEEKITGAAYDGNLSITRSTPTGSYCNSQSTQFALELTFLNVASKTITVRKLIDECSLISGSTDKINFGATINLSGAAASHAMWIRVIAPSSSFASTTLSIVNPSVNWPLQGKTIVSEAKTATGATKRLQLFQSYPQIPGEFWVTSF